VLHRSTNQAVVLPPSRPPSVTNGSFGYDDEADDTSNDTFYSAAEDRSESRTTSSPDEDSTGNLDSELLDTDRGDLSDEEDIMSLSALMLRPKSSGVLSSFTSATPRSFNYRANGIVTPGSVYSSCTATTAPGPQPRRARCSRSRALCRVYQMNWFIRSLAEKMRRLASLSTQTLWSRLGVSCAIGLRLRLLKSFLRTHSGRLEPSV
jgi:hypothetical protein